MEQSPMREELTVSEPASEKGSESSGSGADLSAAGSLYVMYINCMHTVIVYRVDIVSIDCIYILCPV